MRYERERSGELVHVDVKEVARISDGGGRRALGRGCGSARGAGLSCPHVAVDDFSGVSYAELLADERKETARAFVAGAIAFFGGLGVRVERVMTDSGSAYRSAAFAGGAGVAGGSATSSRGPSAPGRTARPSG